MIDKDYYDDDLISFLRDPYDNNKARQCGLKTVKTPIDLDEFKKHLDDEHDFKQWYDSLHGYQKHIKCPYRWIKYLYWYDDLYVIKRKNEYIRDIPLALNILFREGKSVEYDRLADAVWPYLLDEYKNI